MRSLLLLFILLPFMEIGLLIALAGYLGLQVLLLEVLATGSLGLYLLARSGQRGLLQANERLRSGEAPVQQILGDMLLGAGGLMLLLPGLATDLVGFGLLAPPLRNAVSGQWSAQSDLFRYAQRPGSGAEPGSAEAPFRDTRVRRDDGPSAAGDVIEGEFRRED